MDEFDLDVRSEGAAGFGWQTHVRSPEAPEGLAAQPDGLAPRAMTCDTYTNGAPCTSSCGSVGWTQPPYC